MFIYNSPAENFLPKDAKYAAMEIGAFSLPRPEGASGLCCQLPHRVNSVTPLLCSLPYHIIPFMMLHLNRNEASCADKLSNCLCSHPLLTTYRVRIEIH